MTTPTPIKPELLSPAGSPEALAAALDAGADAVYLGLQAGLNARRGATNFSPDELAAAVEAAHARDAKVYLTLNTLVATRETRIAARCVELARRAGIDGVLVSDPMFLALVEHYPDVEFHFSTQAAVNNSAGVEAAKALGIRRVVVGRELSKDEIAACCAVDGVEIEVFVQGAQCVCVSGRCLLSSWGGGRSGNRGTCTSTCRAQWQRNKFAPRRTLSMHDMSLVDHAAELGEMGVASLKIEGRLKSPKWVAQAVSLFRRAIDTPGESLHDEALSLGNYTGRDLTDGFFAGKRSDLCGDSGRVKSDDAPPEKSKEPDKPEPEDEPLGPPASLHVEVGDRVVCTFRWDGHEDTWTVPKTIVRHEKRAMSLALVGKWLTGMRYPGNVPLPEYSASEPDFLVPKKNANIIQTKLCSALNRWQKESTKAPKLTVELPEAVAALSTLPERNRKNARMLGSTPNAVRLRMRHLSQCAKMNGCKKVIVEEAGAEHIPHLPPEAVVAIDPVLYEDQLPAARALIEAAAAQNIPVEVNSFSAWQIAREAGATFEAGPGLGVLSPLAAATLGKLGCRSVTASIEADRRQLQDFAEHAPVEWSMQIYGHPVLMHIRANLGHTIQNGDLLEDARNIVLRVERAGTRTRLRAAEPFSLFGMRNDRIFARWLVADLTGEKSPIATWRKPPRSRNLFNYNRSLS
ncbi:MAG: hypothetical protein HN370_04330 [Phycisphaerales bacterium]|jgi:U32 family peptidase|nr:hypothetical protein [Phycisphaerales bacterium]